MKIPKRLKIGGHSVRVDCSEILPGINGEANSSRNEIKICKSLVQSQKESTLIHEIFHLLNTTMDGDRLGHAFLDSFSEQFYQVLSDNDMLK